MLKRRVLTSLVSIGFRRRDSWTDCLCSNTLLCRTLFSLSPQHTHTHTACCLPLSPHNLSSSSSSLLIHTSSTSLNASRLPSLYSQPVLSTVCLSSTSPPPSSPPLGLPFFYSLLSCSPFPLFTQSHLSVSASHCFFPLLSHIPFSSLVFPVLLTPPAPLLTHPHYLSSYSLSSLHICSRCLSSCSLKRRRMRRGPGGPAAPFIHV